MWDRKIIIENKRQKKKEDNKNIYIYNEHDAKEAAIDSNRPLPKFPSETSKGMEKPKVLPLPVRCFLYGSIIFINILLKDEMRC